MGDFQTIRDRLRQNREVVVLARDLNLASHEVLHGMVATVMTKLESSSLRATGQGQKLMPETDSHDGSDERRVTSDE